MMLQKKAEKKSRTSLFQIHTSYRLNKLKQNFNNNNFSIILLRIYYFVINSDICDEKKSLKNKHFF
jgi:hypothetical protein